MPHSNRDIQTDIQIVTVRITFFEEATHSVRQRQQAFHQQLNHAGHNQHYRTEAHRQVKDTFDIIFCQQANPCPQNHTQHHRLTKDAKALLDLIRIGIQFVNARDFIEHHIPQHTDREENNR